MGCTRRVRTVGVVTRVSPSPTRLSQRARLLRDDVEADPGPVGAEASRGPVVQRHAVLEITDGVLHHRVAAVIRLQFEGLAVAISDERVICVVEALNSSWLPGVGLTRRTMRRIALPVPLVANGVYVVSATSAAPSSQYGTGTQSASAIPPMTRCSAGLRRTVIEKRTPRARHAATTLWL